MKNTYLDGFGYSHDTGANWVGLVLSNNNKRWPADHR